MNPFLWRSILGLLFVSLQILVGADPLRTKRVPSTPQPLAHTVIAESSSSAAEAAGAGGHLIASYGNRHLFELPSGATSLSRTPGIEVRDDFQMIFLNSGTISTPAETSRSHRAMIGAFSGKRLHILQFPGPVRSEWLEALLATGVQIINYLPQNAFLVYGDSASLARVQELTHQDAFARWDGPCLGEYKIHPNARNSKSWGNSLPLGDSEFAIQWVDDPVANPNVLKVLGELKLANIQTQESVPGLVNAIVKLQVSNLIEVASLPSVVSILPHFSGRIRGERQAQIVAGNISGPRPTHPGYLAWLASKGFTQQQFDDSGLVVDIADSGIDNGTTAPGHFGLYPQGDASKSSRVKYSRLQGTPNGVLAGFHCGDTNTNSVTVSTIEGWDGHGTLTAHILAGFDDQLGFPHTDSEGYHYGLGICPFVQIGASVIFDPHQFTNPNYRTLLSEAYDRGARISNNSWGTSNGSAYDQDAQLYDALVRSSGAPLAARSMVVVFVAGNDGPDEGSINSPGTAKNVITVGASESVQSLSISNGGNRLDGSDGSGYPDLLADNANQIADFSGRGPCLDGRMKPDLVAPGTHITGGTPQGFPQPPLNRTGTAFGCFDASGIAALPDSGGEGNTNNFFPLGQEFYTVSTGTSQAAPAVTGASALLWQYFINHDLPPPSPAMTKAFLVNSARYLSWTNDNDSLWSTSQGMGEVNLGMAFDGVPRVLRDQAVEDTFTASGQHWTYTGTAANPSKPIRITVAWTDAPGSTIGAAYQNDLDLVVTIGNRTYKGNCFDGGYSVTGGASDYRNNMESVYLSPGSVGAVTVTISAANIVAAGVPNPAGLPRQDFALVIYNFIPAAPTIRRIEFQGATAVISFDSTIWATYSLEYKNTLADEVWQPVPGTGTGTGGLAVLTDATGMGASRYYRIAAH